jgi:hypothetical protein
MDTPRTDGDIARAWRALAALYAASPADPVIAGARAAAEWTCGTDSPVTPVTGQPAPATLVRVEDESHRSAMVELGILPGSREYARGASAWLFWWTGLRPLPPWLSFTRHGCHDT